jgi:hypothetical protein
VLAIAIRQLNRSTAARVVPRALNRAKSIGDAGIKGAKVVLVPAAPTHATSRPLQQARATLESRSIGTSAAPRHETRRAHNNVKRALAKRAALQLATTEVHKPAIAALRRQRHDRTTLSVE